MSCCDDMSCSDFWIFPLSTECDGEVADREIINHHGIKCMCLRHHTEHVEIIELYLYPDPDNPPMAKYPMNTVLAMTPEERHQAWLSIQ